MARRRDRTRINEQIRAREVRLIDSDGENLGVLDRDKAIEKAREAELDLIEISPTAKPPVAKIMDYGKFKYEQSKKEKEQRAKQTSTETKIVQIKIGTGKHDLELKAKRASEWLSEGNRVKFELYLRGRARGLDRKFLRERMERMLKLLTVDYNIAEGPKKEPKGLYMILEKE